MKCVPPKLRIAAIAALVLAALPCIAYAQNYPAKPIRYIVPFAPGGPTDIMSRAISEKVAAAWSQPVVVDNRGGAGGNIGAELVAKSPADGYTMMIGHVGTHAINVSLYRKINFDPIKDFQPITLIATLPLALVVHPNVPAKSAQELIALTQKDKQIDPALSPHTRRSRLA